MNTKILPFDDFPDVWQGFSFTKKACSKDLTMETKFFKYSSWQEGDFLVGSFLNVEFIVDIGDIIKAGDKFDIVDIDYKEGRMEVYKNSDYLDETNYRHTRHTLVAGFNLELKVND